MDKLKGKALFAAGLAVLVVNLVISAPRDGHAPGAAPVLVTNTTSGPVPTAAQGTTVISGTVQAQQSGTWAVGLSGTPAIQVGNSSTNPVPVRDVDNPARQPFQRFVSLSMPPGDSDAVAFLEVPANKRLVIEFASFSGQTFGAEPGLLAGLTTTAGGISGVYRFSMTPGPATEDTANQQMRVYADPGTQILVSFIRQDHSAETTINASISGYLVNP